MFPSMRQSIIPMAAIISPALVRTAVRVPRRKKDSMKEPESRSPGIGWTAFLSMLLSGWFMLFGDGASRVLPSTFYGGVHGFLMDIPERCQCAVQKII